MSGQGIIRETPVKFDAACLGLFMYQRVYLFGTICIQICFSIFIGKPNLRRSLLLISISFGSGASIRISAFEFQSLTPRILKIFENFQCKSRKYTLLAIRTLMHHCVQFSSHIPTKGPVLFDRQILRARSCATQTWKCVIVTVPEFPMTGDPPLHHNSFRHKEFIQTDGRQFIKIIGRKKVHWQHTF